MFVDFRPLLARVRLKANRFVEWLLAHSKDALRGSLFGLALAFPFYVAWLAFQKHELFAFPYMRKVSLVVIWGTCVFQFLPDITVKFPWIEVSKKQQVPPDDAVEK